MFGSGFRPLLWRSGNLFRPHRCMSGCSGYLGHPGTGWVLAYQFWAKFWFWPGTGHESEFWAPAKTETNFPVLFWVFIEGKCSSFSQGSAKSLVLGIMFWFWQRNLAGRNMSSHVFNSMVQGCQQGNWKYPIDFPLISSRSGLQYAGHPISLDISIQIMSHIPLVRGLVNLLDGIYFGLSKTILGWSLTGLRHEWAS